MSLGPRVVIAIALVHGPLLGSVAGVGLAGWQAKWALRAELAAALAGARQTVASAYEDLPRSDHPARDLRQLVATFDGNLHLAATLVDAHGDVIFASHVSPALGAPRWFRDLLGDTLPDAHIPAPAPAQGTIVLRLLFANDVGALWREFEDLAGVLAVSWLLGSVMVWLAVGRALRPLASTFSVRVRADRRRRLWGERPGKGTGGGTGSPRTRGQRHGAQPDGRAPPEPRAGGAAAHPSGRRARRPRPRPARRDRPAPVRGLCGRGDRAADDRGGLYRSGAGPSVGDPAGLCRARRRPWCATYWGD